MGISREQALECFRSDDLVGIGMEADAVRRRLHPEGVVSYALGTRVEFTAVLQAAKDRRDEEAQLDRMCEQIGAQVAAGATGMRLSGIVKVKSEAGLQWLEGMLRELRRQYPAVWIEGLPASDIVGIAGRCGMTPGELLARVHDAGLDAIAGDGVELAGAEGRVGAQEWVKVHRAAHELGMRTTAGMVFGAGETVEERVDFLEAVRGVQEQTGGFRAFVAVAAAAPGGRGLDGVTAVERLKTLAIARMFLENIENVQADGAAAGIDGLKVLQTALRFGANDAGWVSAEGANEEDVRRVIRDAGFKPAQRDAAYRAMMLG